MIYDSDVKIWKSKKMIVQTPDAGGERTAEIVPDGEIHNVFGPVPTLVQEATGYLYYARVHAGIDTPDQQIYWRSLVFILEPPTDPNTEITLLYTGKPFETWGQIRDRFERFLIAGSRWPGRLLEIQPEGAKTVVLYQRLNESLPEIGQVIVLTNNDGQSNSYQQYTQITKVSDVVRTFTRYIGSSAVNFDRRRVTIETADALEADFDGGPPTDNDADPTGATLRSTTVVNAVAFKGIARLPNGAEPGTSIQVDSIWAQIVPPLRSSTPLPTTNPLRQVAALIPSGQSDITINFSTDFGPGVSLYLGTPCLRGEFTLTAGSVNLTDDKAGNLLSGSTIIGSIDYERGIVTAISTAPNYQGNKQIIFKPAAAPTLSVYSASFGVDVNTRDINYSIELIPAPALGTIRVDYLAQGKWYSLNDRGDGVIKGSESAYGSGRYSPATNLATATLGALPDIGAEVIFYWATPGLEFNRSGAVVKNPGFRFQLSNKNGGPGTFEITWNDGIGDKTATDDGIGGITGDATGEIDYSAPGGTILIVRPNILPPMGTEFSIGCESGDIKSFTYTPSNGDYGAIWHSFDLPDTDIAPGSIRVGLTLSRWAFPDRQIQAKDNGSNGFDLMPESSCNYISGHFEVKPSAIPFSFYSLDPNGITGSTLTLQQAQSFGWSGVGTVQNYMLRHSGWVVPGFLSSPIVVLYRVVGAGTSNSQTFQGDTLIVELSTYHNESIISNAVRFKIGNYTYVDKNGIIYANPNISTGTGLLAGNIDYASGETPLAVWEGGAANTINIESLATTAARQQVSEIVGRAPSSPLRPGSLQLLADKVDGGNISFFAPENGKVEESEAVGIVDVSNGLFHIRFGAWVDPAGHESEYWFSGAETNESGQKWKPIMVYGDTLEINGVAFSYQPSSADRIGVNARRLPPDGRVPKINKGDIGVIHHTANTVLPIPITPGSVHSAGRDKLSRAKLLDATGALIEAGATTYTANLPAGTIAFSTNLNLSQYTQPLTLRHTIMDRRTVGEVDISGDVQISQPLMRSYPAGSYFSTAIEGGDLQARVDFNVMFTQASWSVGSPEWSDSRVGSEPSFQIRTAPIVTNDGAITQRWAFYMVSTTTFLCYGEDLGDITNGIPVSINADFAPINPATQTAENPLGVPYFTLLAGSLSIGSVGNAARINTYGASVPVEVFRTILPGAQGVAEDHYSIICIGDTDQ